MTICMTKYRSYFPWYLGKYEFKILDRVYLVDYKGQQRILRTDSISKLSILNFKNQNKEFFL